ncbi:hypothetical protein AAFF_G00215260, partial [Aldrovandia affinis]
GTLAPIPLRSVYVLVLPLRFREARNSPRASSLPCPLLLILAAAARFHLITERRIKLSLSKNFLFILLQRGRRGEKRRSRRRREREREMLTSMPVQPVFATTPSRAPVRGVSVEPGLSVGGTDGVGQAGPVQRAAVGALFMNLSPGRGLPFRAGKTT